MSYSSLIIKINNKPHVSSFTYLFPIDSDNFMSVAKLDQIQVKQSRYKEQQTIEIVSLLKEKHISFPTIFLSPFYA
jgi:hypothetical protein